MMNGGEAADQMVSYAFKGGEVVLRLSGSAAKNLAVYLANMLKEGGPSKGKTTLKQPDKAKQIKKRREKDFERRGRNIYKFHKRGMK